LDGVSLKTGLLAGGKVLWRMTTKAMHKSWTFIACKSSPGWKNGIMLGTSCSMSGSYLSITAIK